MFNKVTFESGTKAINFLQVLFTILILTVLQFNPALAGDKIKIRLHQPPPNKLGASDLWKLDLENTTKEDITIYLQGTVSEEKDGLIAEGQSKPFVVKPGRSSYSYSDFKNGSVSWKNKKFEDVIVRTGNAPSGSYTICVTAKLESGEVTGQENCIEQKIEILGVSDIMLTYPADSAELDPDTLPGLVFIWEGGCPPRVLCDYTLRIVEIRGEQSPDDAIQHNSSFFEKKEIKENKFQYPQSAPKFEEGKKYAWQVKTQSTQSSTGIFMITIGGGSVTLSLIPTGQCNDTDCCCYKIYVNSSSQQSWNTFQIDYYDPYSGTVNYPTPHPAVNFIKATNPVIPFTAIPMAPPLVNYSVWCKPGIPFTYPSQYAGEICLKKMSVPYQVRIFWSSDCGMNWVLQHDLITVNPNICQADTCNCNKWKSSTIVISKPGGINVKTACGSTYNLAAASSLTINFPSYLCLPVNCNSTYSWILNGPQGLTVGSGNSVTYNFSTAGTYNVTVYSYCGGHKCDSCKVNIVLADNCKCGKYKNHIVSVTPTGGPSVNISCGMVYNTTAPKTLTIGFPVYTCPTNCITSYHGTVSGPLGNSNFTGNSITYNFSTAGVYTITEYAYCGTHKCDSCKITVNAVDSCNCGHWNSILAYGQGFFDTLHCMDSLRNIHTGNSVTLMPNYVCSGNNCAPVYSWYINGPAGFSQGTSVPVNYTFSANGLYQIVFRVSCGGHVCDSCRIFTRVDSLQNCQCGTFSNIQLNQSSYTGNFPVTNNSSIYISTHIFSAGSVINLIPSFSCIGCSTGPQYNWYLMQYNSGTVTTTILPYHTTSSISYTFTSAGRYHFRIRGVCGTTQCTDTVGVTFDVQ